MAARKQYRINELGEANLAFERHSHFMRLLWFGAAVFRIIKTCGWLRGVGTEPLALTLALALQLHMSLHNGLRSLWVVMMAK